MNDTTYMEPDDVFQMIQRNLERKINLKAIRASFKAPTTELDLLLSWKNPSHATVHQSLPERHLQAMGTLLSPGMSSFSTTPRMVREEPSRLNEINQL